MKKILGVIFTATLLSAPLAQAEAPNKVIGDWTCEDFVALQETSRPVAVSYANALNHKDKPDSAVLNVKDIETVTPVIYQACSQKPQQSFTTVVHQEWDKFKKHL
ncbi:acid-activated periplasmic chaperone HdeA [Citrobacter sp. JGM124]|uniref:acid-activated periplasmic chaperone HdeA n=1 Tax=Citrobacter sp. JGM124 TaxID=2799789 RepID=UPI001BA57D57|nr:acid-activated periplasmic chaperone HdeA [Citrobacter sp. JGM124]MBS0848253.1 acid-resistance protein [Citrobacter sp. JGM124]